ncbi:NUDIX domain-containing protein, partial [Candidatus Dojkabacteria bacterium]|nr:NUDIX domain-containing protein [Candidatus Dojkabacteria bacterium]
PYFFPPGITRVLGGGIMQNESIIKAAQRELKEELTINVSESDLLHVETLEVNARDKEENSYKSKVNFVIVTHSIDSYTAGDDVISIDVLTEVQLNNLIRLYENLPETLWYRGEEGEFCWKDYGKMYSPVHKIVKDIAYRTH